MVHKGAPRGLWGNTISSWQFGIYREAPGPPPPPNGLTSRRLRCCVVAAMATVVVLLVSIMVYDVARSHGSPARDKGVVQRLLLLQTSTATMAPPPSSTTAGSPGLETLSSPLMEAELEPTSTEETPRARSVSFYDEQTEGVSSEELRAPQRGFFLSPSSTPRPKPPRRKEPERRKDLDRGPRGQQPRPFLRPPQRPRGQQQQVPPYYNFAAQNKPYAQLTNYRYPNDAKNIQDIIKYLTANGNKITQRQRQNLVFGGSNKPKKAVKFSGVYLNPQVEDDEDGMGYQDSSDEKSVMGEMMMANHRHNKYAETNKGSSLNGHAYIADPFHAYKPSDPSEVNLLANSDFRFAPSDSYIRFNDQKTDNRLSAIDKYFPRPPINFSKPPATPPSLTEDANQMNKYPGTYTSAIYRPFGKEPESAKNKNGRKRTRPFSVMLDIYPMTHEANKKPPLRPVRPAAVGIRPRPLATQPQRNRAPEQQQQQQDDGSETRHQMIVHLNLYPKKKKPNSNSRSDDEDAEGDEGGEDDEDIPSFHVSVRGGDLASMWQRGAHCQDRSDSDHDYLEVGEGDEDNEAGEEEEDFPTEEPQEEAAGEPELTVEPRDFSSGPDAGDSALHREGNETADATARSADIALLPLETGPFLVPSASARNSSAAPLEDS